MSFNHFSIGDVVRLTRPGEGQGRVGKIERKAHPASPWTWVVYSLPGDKPFFGAAVNADGIVHVEEGSVHVS